MFTRTIAARYALLIALLGSAALLSQAPSAPSSSSAGLVFPVTMRQKVTAGTTSVGTKVEAKLTVGTLVDGAVVPEGAILSGEVIESVAKSASGPSRLAIRIDAAQWKNRAAPKVLQFTKKVYLTAWYYPELSPRELSDDSPDATGSSRRRSGDPPYSVPSYPVPNSPASQPFPGRDPNRSDDPLSPPRAPAPSISKNRVLMKNVEVTRNGEGAVILVSQRSSIKLNKSTTYVLAAGDLAGGPG